MDIYIPLTGRAVVGNDNPIKDGVRVPANRLHPEAVAWLDENAGPYLRGWTHTYFSDDKFFKGFRVRIHDDKIALMFKIAWGGR